MSGLLLKLFVKNHENVEDPAVRTAYGNLSGGVGIFCNLLLFAAKLIIGTLSGSVSITADAVNNLSDASGSIVTLLGFRMASKPADEEHPYGHARMEYFSGLIVAVLILVIGLELGKSSVEKILHPEAVEFSAALVIVLVLSILVKLWMMAFNTRLGKKIDSTTLIATGADSRNDVISTTAVLISCIVGKLTGSDFGFVFVRNGDTLPRHPGQLYEAVAYFVFFLGGLVLYKLRESRVGRGFFFGYCLTTLHVPDLAATAITNLTDNPIIIALLLDLIILVLGCIMDMAPIILIATPILLPIATSIGIDPIQFGIIVVLNCGIGLLTPPVGAVLFIGSAVAKRPMEKVVKATLPFYACMLITLLLLTFILFILGTLVTGAAGADSFMYAVF